MGNHDWDDRTTEEIAKQAADERKAMSDFLLGKNGQRMLKTQKKYQDLRAMERLEEQWDALTQRSLGVCWQERDALMKKAKAKAKL